MRRLVDLLHRLARDRRGVSALEAAIAMPLLILALCGVFEFGINVYNRQQLQAAVQAGVQYAIRNPNDTAGVKNTILGALPSDSGATVGDNAITYSCECNDGTSISCSPMGTCASGSPRRVMTMTVERPPVLIFSSIIGLQISTLRAQGSVNVATQ